MAIIFTRFSIIIMNKFKIWLLEKSKIQTNTIVIVLLLSIASRYFIDEKIISTKDFFSPVVYLLLILWVYYSLFFCVVFNEDVKEKIINKRNLNDPKDFFGKLIKLTLLIFFSYRTFFIYGRLGVVFSLLIITITCILCIYIQAKADWSNYDFLTKFVFLAALVGYIYFKPWKAAYCYEFGVKEIGNFFEKHTYEAKYFIKITSLDRDSSYTLPADIIVSEEFSDYDSYDTETDVITYEIRKVKIKNVYLNNGEKLFFEKCLVPIDNSDDYTCTDQNGVEWRMELTKKKVQ